MPVAGCHWVTKSNFLHLLPYSCLILYRTLRLCMHSSFRLFITVFSSPAHFSPTLLELYASSPPTLISLYSSPQLFYHALYSSQQLIFHCIHLFNSYITVFISSTLISLYSVLHLFLSLYSSSQHIFTEFMEHHFYPCIYISSSFTAVFISPTTYLPLFYSPNLKLLFHVCLRCSSFTGCCVL